MKYPLRFLLMLLLLFECLTAMVLVLFLIYQNEQIQQYLPYIIVAFVFLIITVQLIVAYRLKKTLFSPLASVNRGIEIILKTHASHHLDLPSNHRLGVLPQAVHELGEEIAATRAEIAKAHDTGAKKSQLQKDNLERVIESLEQGVIVCDGQANQLLYNPTAHRIFNQHPGFGLGRTLFDLLPQTPVEQSLVRFDSETQSSFICIVKDRETILNCKIARLPIADFNSDIKADAEKAFVITFDDVTALQKRLRKQDQLFTCAIESLRSPLANLRAAAENLATFNDISPTESSTFSQIITEESVELSNQLNNLAKNERALVGQEWQITDIYSQDLVNIIAIQCEKKHGLDIINSPPGMWLTTDIQALVAIIEYLCLFVAQKQSVHHFEFSVSSRHHGIYFDICWLGQVLANNDLERCISDKLTTVVGHPKIGKLINRLGGEIWSQAHPKRDNYAIIRLPLPAPKSGDLPTETYQEQPRPVTYDFDLLEDRFQHTLLLDKPLKDLTFVVFDTETTGLHPEEGDEIISLAAVRIVNQRILEHETFDQLINPGRNIPAESIVFHGITPDMVADSPNIIDVLPRFKHFAKDSVLVAHNAWFDMAFIRRSEAQAKSYFPNPILDTLMLSVCLHGHDVDHSLDAIANRLGIDIIARHTALGDSITTANILLAQINMLEARGIITLKNALDSYH